MKKLLQQGQNVKESLFLAFLAFTQPLQSPINIDVPRNYIAELSANLIALKLGSHKQLSRRLELEYQLTKIITD